ncbi:CAP domain-containing protein [Amylibacter sp. SFDW26]|nr:CAP domain-containing protein [Amylibacter sp. SFDW26]
MGCFFPSYADEVQDLTTLLNAERKAKGRKVLRVSDTLNVIAQKHAEDMVANGYFSHTGRDGSTLGKRMKRQGYKFCYAAENIASGQKTPEETMSSWRNSPGHNKNNLSRKSTEVGAGFAGQSMWVLVFGKPC